MSVVAAMHPDVFQARREMLGQAGRAAEHGDLLLQTNYRFYDKPNVYKSFGRDIFTARGEA